MLSIVDSSMLSTLSALSPSSSSSDDDEDEDSEEEEPSEDEERLSSSLSALRASVETETEMSLLAALQLQGSITIITLEVLTYHQSLCHSHLLPHPTNKYKQSCIEMLPSSDQER